MLKEVRLQNFKRYRDQRFTFRSDGITLLGGGNNSGKSTVLQGLAVWEFCRALLEATKGRRALRAGVRSDPVGVSAEEFSPIALPSLAHLWCNLNGKVRNGGNQQDAGYTLRLSVKWDVPAAVVENQPPGPPVEHELEMGLMLMHDRVYVKQTCSTLQDATPVPKFAYLPPFAGIQTREERMSPAAQKRLIGRGLAGAALRNVLHDLHLRSISDFANLKANRRRIPVGDRQQFFRKDPWSQLADVLQRVFKAGLVVQPFNELHQTALHVDLFRGDFQGSEFRKSSGFNLRDIMVEGSGFLQWLSVYALAVSPQINVLLLDEPDAHLHPTLQSHLLDRLKALATENQKQALLATHSTTVLTHAEVNSIFRMEDAKYLDDDSGRVLLFEGIGSVYCPLLDQLKRHKRVLFYEGSSDLELLTIWAKTLGIALPRNVVFRESTRVKREERALIFGEFRKEIADLKGLSLQDRDDYQLTNVKQNLTFDGLKEFESGFGLRKWRRRNIESYLLCTRAIAQASGKTEAEVTDVFALNGVAMPPGAAATAWDGPEALALCDGKKVILYPKNPNSVVAKLGCSYKQIAEAMLPAEIPDDVKEFLKQLVQFAKP